MNSSLLFPRAILTALLFLALTPLASAQEGARYVRIHLRDKGTTARVLTPGDPLYAQAAALLTDRSLARRRKVLPADSIVSTDDLPIYAPYLQAIAVTGAQIKQSSRWLNTVMVLADSTQYEALRALPFVDSAATVRARRSGGASPIGKLSTIMAPDATAHEGHGQDAIGCLSSYYGLATAQNRAIGIDVANERGFAGEGIFVGVLDSGFDWRKVAALREARIVAERDFVNNDNYTGSDQPGEPSNPADPAGGHGTLVTSVIGGYQPGQMIGGASKVTFALARTEDVFSERHIEEDNFVAGLEWLEALGVDVTNTSLGYTTYDFPESSYTPEDLTGHDALASRGVNRAVRLGMACYVAAGNEALSFVYVSVPAEADSAVAVAAVNPDGTPAYFSSRGSSAWSRQKPDLAALGVRVYGSDAKDSSRLTAAQGTSLASPLATAAASVILSAAPELRPYELRDLMTRTASRSVQGLAPDTAVGHGTINVARALDTLSLRRPIAGVPQIYLFEDTLRIAAWTAYLGLPGAAGLERARYLDLRIRRPDASSPLVVAGEQPVRGIATWDVPLQGASATFNIGDSVLVELVSRADSRVIRSATALLTPTYAQPMSTLCHEVPTVPRAPVFLQPNPSTGLVTFGFTLPRESTVSLVVYNAIGQEVERLIDGQRLVADDYDTLWNGRGLAAGAYFFSLTIDGNTSVSKVVLFPR